MAYGLTLWFGVLLVFHCQRVLAGLYFCILVHRGYTRNRFFLVDADSAHADCRVCKFWEDEWRPYVFLVVHVCVFRVVLYDRSDADAYIYSLLSIMILCRTTSSTVLL